MRNQTLGDETTTRDGYVHVELAVSVALLLGIAVYVSAAWGGVAEHFPAPLDGWGRLVRPTIKAWQVTNPALWLAAHLAFGMVVPGSVLLAAGRLPGDVGLGLPNALGGRLMVSGVLVSIPFGLWLLNALPGGAIPATLRFGDLCAFLAMVPEHFLICGVVTAIMLPGRRLPCDAPIAPIEGGPFTRVLRWLGFAQPESSARGGRWLGWFGLNRASFGAVIASGLMFGMIHVGKPALELVLSVPGGIAIAYVTLRSRSNWPALCAHWSLNLAPRGLSFLFG